MNHPLTLNGNLLAGIDLETTGLTEGFHEIVQIAIAPIGPDLQPHSAFKPFMRYVRPKFPERADAQALQTNGLSLDWLMTTAPESETVIEQLDDYIYSLGLGTGKGVIPLAHNWAFESGFLKAWLGIEHLQTALSRRARDSMLYAGSLMDRAELAGLAPPFTGLALKDLTGFFGIENALAHDALSDAVATIHLYRHLLEWDLVQQNQFVPFRTPHVFELPPVTVDPQPATWPITPYQPVTPSWPITPAWPVFTCGDSPNEPSFVVSA